MNWTERCDRLDQAIAEGLVCTGSWYKDGEDGVERACLLVQMFPEVGEGSVERCAAHGLPLWMGYLTPWIDDNCVAWEWESIIRKYATLIRGSSILGDHDWAALKIVFSSALIEHVYKAESRTQDWRNRVIRQLFGEDDGLQRACSHLGVSCGREVSTELIKAFFELWATSIEARQRYYEDIS